MSSSIDPCSWDSEEDCGRCTKPVDENQRWFQCTAICTSTGERCKRSRQPSNEYFCSQHENATLRKKSQHEKTVTYQAVVPYTQTVKWIPQLPIEKHFLPDKSDLKVRVLVYTDREKPQKHKRQKIENNSSSRENEDDFDESNDPYQLRSDSTKEEALNDQMNSYFDEENDDLTGYYASKNHKKYMKLRQKYQNKPDEFVDDYEETVRECKEFQSYPIPDNLTLANTLYDIALSTPVSELKRILSVNNIHGPMFRIIEDTVSLDYGRPEEYTIAHYIYMDVDAPLFNYAYKYQHGNLLQMKDHVKDIYKNENKKRVENTILIYVPSEVESGKDIFENWNIQVEFIPAGTLLYHGTPYDGHVYPKGPAWFALDKSFATGIALMTNTGKKKFHNSDREWKDMKRERWSQFSQVGKQNQPILANDAKRLLAYKTKVDLLLINPGSLKNTSNLMDRIGTPVALMRSDQHDMEDLSFIQRLCSTSSSPVASLFQLLTQRTKGVFTEQTCQSPFQWNRDLQECQVNPKFAEINNIGYMKHTSAGYEVALCNPEHVLQYIKTEIISNADDE